MNSPYVNFSLKKRLLGGAMWSVDLFLSFFKGKAPRIPKVLDSILVSNNSHIGDVIISTGVLGALRKQYPDAKIGFLVGSWSKKVVEHHPLVDEVFVFDHFMLDRSGRTFLQKLWHSLRSRYRVRKALKKANYSLSINLYYSYPTVNVLFWQVGIPIRVGYARASFGSLLTHSQPFETGLAHVLEYHKRQLQTIGVEDALLKDARPEVFSIVNKLTNKEIENLHLPYPNYIVIHIGTGHPKRLWDDEHWRVLAHLLSRSGFSVIFTGTGTVEESSIERIVAGMPHCVNACHRLSWEAYVHLLSGAKVVVGVESMAGHLASALGVPFVVIKSGTTSHEWSPFGTLGSVLTYKKECVPCGQFNGCETMDCVKLVSPAAVFDAIDVFLPK